LVEKILKSASLKSTKQRINVISLIEFSKNPITAEEVYILLERDKKNINLSTIYRTLKTLTEKNILLKILKSDGTASYQLNDSLHNHYITCNTCHSSMLIDKCPMKELGEIISKDTGFEVTGHSLQLVGICPKCIKEGNKKIK